MPIKPENKHRYPSNWKEIRAQILERAAHRCEFCGVENHVFIQRHGKGMHDYTVLDCLQAEVASMDGEKVVKVVLTIAHLDHTPENCHPANLKALCQQCHNRYDMPHRVKNRRVVNPGQMSLLEGRG